MMRPWKIFLTLVLICGFSGAGIQSAHAIGDQPDDYSNDLRTKWIGSMQRMAEQASVLMESQILSIGMMLDAKHQLETQLLFQEKLAEAHRDYQPSEQMCTFGTFARDLYQTEERNAITRTALVQFMQQRETGNGDSTGHTAETDRLSRLIKFRNTFCDRGDNGGGLGALCPNATVPAMRNRDINYTATVDQPLSLDINMSDAQGTDDEEAVFALLNNLFAHKPNDKLPTSAMGQNKYQYHYANLRSIIAMRGIARNSFANIIAMKTAAPDTVSNGPYLRALLREFGMGDDEIAAQLGENPSYYAQMELLTKKIYQSPNFYTGLYDKPANVQRIRAAMKAIKLMQDRDIHSAFLRREMLLSMILEVRLRNKAENVYAATESALFSTPTNDQTAP